MLLTVLVAIIIIAVIYALNSGRGLNRNERLYLKRRGYDPPGEFDEGPPISKDTQLLNLIESLSDISSYSRQRAAENLSRMCAAGQRDVRMLAPLIAALDDSDVSVRATAAMALGTLGDRGASEALKRRIEVEESIHVRASLETALAQLANSSYPG